MPIESGRYEGATDSGEFALQIRADLRTGKVSGDQYFGNAIDPNAFSCSFTSIGPAEISVDHSRLAADVTITGSISAGWQAPGTLECQEAASGSIHAKLHCSAINGLPEWLCSADVHLVGPEFRSATYQLDVFDSDAAGALAPLARRVEENFNRAGIQLTGNTAGRRVTMTDEQGNELPDRGGWSDAELYAWMSDSNAAADFRRQARAWKIYVMVVESFRSEADTGVMFDHKVDRFPRQGAAVSWTAFAGDANFNDKFVRTLTHEIGHTFNLPHAWDQTVGPRFASASYMNYPSKFSEGDDAYWRAFNRQNNFDDVELDFVRHGHLEHVVMGGSQLESGSHDDGSLIREESAANLRLILRPTRRDRVNNLYEFGEPVRIEAKLENVLTGQDVSAADVLDPAHRQTTYRIQRPDGTTRTFRPLAFRCGGVGRRTAVLMPTQKALYEDVNLAYGADGLTFLAPGPYRVQAVYSPDSNRIVSNVLDIWIRYPTRQVEDLVVPVLTDEVGTYLATWGNPSLRGAERALETLTADIGIGQPSRRRGAAEEAARAARPIAEEFLRCRYQATARGHRTIDIESVPGRLKVRYCCRPSEVAAAEDLAGTYGKPLEQFAGQLDRLFPNLGTILFGNLAGRLAAWFESRNDAEPAKKVLREIRKRFDRQAVGESIRRRFCRKMKLSENAEKELVSSGSVNRKAGR